MLFQNILSMRYHSRQQLCCFELLWQLCTSSLLVELGICQITIEGMQGHPRGFCGGMGVVLVEGVDQGQERGVSVGLCDSFLVGSHWL